MQFITQKAVMPEQQPNRCDEADNQDDPNKEKLEDCRHLPSLEQARLLRPHRLSDGNDFIGKGDALRGHVELPRSSRQATLLKGNRFVPEPEALICQTLQTRALGV